MSKKLIGILVFLAVIILVLIFWNRQRPGKVKNFEECQKAGGGIGASYPAICIDGHGNSFYEVVDFNSCKMAGGAIAESYPEQCILDGKSFPNPTQQAPQP